MASRAVSAFAIACSRFHFGLVFLGHGVEHVPQLVIPATLLRTLRINRRERAPDPEMAIGDGELRRPQAAALQIPQHRRPTLRRFPLPAHDGEHHLPAARIRADQHEERGLAVLKAGLHVDPVGPEVHELHIAQVPCCHAAYCACQVALRRRIALALNGAPSPSSPRSASSKSPSARPCR